VFLSDDKMEKKLFAKGNENNIFLDSTVETVSRAETSFDDMPATSTDTICDNEECTASPGKSENTTIPDELSTAQGVGPIYKMQENQSPDKQQLHNWISKDTSTSLVLLPNSPSMSNQSYTLTVASRGISNCNDKKKRTHRK